MAEENKVLRLVYTFFLGVLLAVFVGVGVNTFYPGPPEPEYPQTILTGEGKVITEEQRAAEIKFEAQVREHNKTLRPYNRNVSIIALIAAVTLLAVSLVFSKKLSFLADGVLLGGLFTLLYSLARSFASQDSKYIFSVVTIALIVVLYLGYARFIKKPQATKQSRTRNHS